MREPANDGRSWTTDDLWYVCRCGSPQFNILHKAGYNYVVCAKCEANVTMEALGNGR